MKLLHIVSYTPPTNGERMKRSKNLENDILELFILRDEQKLRWSQILNTLLCMEKNSQHIQDPTNRDSQKALGVKVTRALKRLIRDELLSQPDHRHKNVSYSITEKGRKELYREREDSNQGIAAGVIFTGVYKPGCTLQGFRNEAIRQWMDAFEQRHWPNLKKAWEEADRHFRKSLKSRSNDQ